MSVIYIPPDGIAEGTSGAVGALYRIGEGVAEVGILLVRLYEVAVGAGVERVSSYDDFSFGCISSVA